VGRPFLGSGHHAWITATTRLYVRVLCASSSQPYFTLNCGWSIKAIFILFFIFISQTAVEQPVFRATTNVMMSSLTWFLFVYILGGLTFIPLLILSLLLHAYFAFPIVEDTAYREPEADAIVRPGDDLDAIKRAQKTLGEKFQPRNSHEADVAAGYFAVCREYVPGGVNGKPPERSTPLGSTVVSTPSQSVYQSMYRSIFDRKPNTSPLDNKGIGKPQKKGGNVFYVVLRYQKHWSHLFWYIC